jgi:hypothetical protein
LLYLGHARWSSEDGERVFVLYGACRLPLVTVDAVETAQGLSVGIWVLL